MSTFAIDESIVTCNWPDASCGMQDDELHMARGAWLDKDLGLRWQCHACYRRGASTELFKNGGTL